MDYREIGKNLDFSKHLKVIKPDLVLEWKVIINNLLFAPFVKQLEPHEESNTRFDVFIFICDANHFIIRQDSYGTKIFYSNDRPLFFSSSFDEYPNCDLLNPMAVHVTENGQNIVFSCVAYYHLIKALVAKKFISHKKAKYLLTALNSYQKSILDEVDIELQDTDYFKHVWGFYHSALKLVDRRYTDYERGITISRFLDTPAIILSFNTYQEVYLLNKHNQMIVLPIDSGGNSVAFKSKYTFRIENVVDMKDDFFIEHTYPMGYFSSLIDFNGPPYTLKAINPNLFQAHQNMLFDTFDMMSNINK